MNTVLLTGVIRSGTTLCCSLLNQLPNVVALDEPLKMTEIQALRGQAFVNKIEQRFNQYREMVLQQKQAFSAQTDQQLGQHYSEVKTTGGLRERIVHDGLIAIDKPLDQNFTLVIKHVLPFLLNLETLIGSLPIYGIVRNPMSVLASMNTLATLKDGYYASYREALPGLVEELEKLDDKADRMIALLSWYFEQCKPLLANQQIIYYEDLIASQGKALMPFTPQAANLQEPLVSYNANKIYGSTDILELGNKLLASDGAFWDYYSKDSAEQLLIKLTEK